MSAASPAAAAAVQRPRRHRLEGDSPYGLQRLRIVSAMAELAAAEGRDAVRIDALMARAQVSKTTFYELFTDLEDCFADAVKRAFDRLFAGIAEAVEQVESDGPAQRAAVTIAALIAVLDEDRQTARLCLVEAYAGDPVARSLRNAAVHRLAHLFADGFEPEDRDLHDALARTAAGAILGLAENALLEDPERSLRDLTRSAIYHGLVPFTDREIATAWSENPPAIGGDLAQLRPDGPDVGPGEQRMYTELARVTLLHLESHPGSRNIDVARAIGVRHESQISRHLVRLERAGVVARRRQGRTNAWQLTDRGREAARTLRDATRRNRSERAGPP